MRLNKALIFLTLIGTLVAGCLPVFADEEEEQKNKPKVTVTLGARAVSTDDSKVRAGEYRSLESGVNTGFTIEQATENAAWSAAMRWFDTDEFDGSFFGDFGRVIRFEGSFTRFLHRLEHDPLTNLFAVKSPKVVSATDHDPGRQYGIVTTDLRSRMTFQHPEVPNLVFTADYRQQHREGTKQVRVAEHCTACHIHGSSTRVNQLMQEVVLGGHLTAGRFGLSAEFQGRTFEERGPTPMHTYSDVFHPTTGLPIFNDRASYDNTDGPLPYQKVAGNSRWSARLDASFDGEDAGTFNAGMVYTSVENDDTGNSLTYTGVRGSWNRVLTDGLSLSLRSTAYAIDNDDVFVDVVERPAVAGTYPGLTYAERWGAETDFTRYSVSNRDVLQFDADIAWRMLRGSLVKLEYLYRKTDRDYFAVTEGGETTTTLNRIKASLTTRFSKETRLNTSLRYEDTESPFSGVNVAGSTSFNPPAVASPLAPGSVQYFELYAARIVDLTNQPTSLLEAKANLSHRFSPKFSVNGGITYQTQENDSLDYSTWGKDRLSATLSSWFAIGPDFHGTISWSYRDEETDTMFVLPIFDG